MKKVQDRNSSTRNSALVMYRTSLQNGHSSYFSAPGFRSQDREISQVAYASSEISGEENSAAKSTS